MKVYKRRRLAEVLPANAQEGAELAAENLEIDEIQNDQVTLPEDLLFKIFILLPAESLYRIQFVCKEWLSVINCSVFIRCHAQKSETVLICHKHRYVRPYLKSCYHFMDLEPRGDNNFAESEFVDYLRIFASCDGLVLALKKNCKSLLLTNPVTRKHTELPLGRTARSVDNFYSLSFCKKENTYKIVHLLNTSSQDIGCEIMSIITREWKTIDGPAASDSLRSDDIYQKPVPIAGSLYWIPRRNGFDYLVSVNVDEEKFSTEKLPTVCTENDRIFEMGGFLGLVTYATNRTMEVWILRTGGDLKENWIKRHSIDLVNFDGTYPIAICSPRNGEEMVFLFPHQSLCVFNFEKNEMWLIYSNDWYNDDMHKYSTDDPIRWYNCGSYIPHRNTLTTWENPSPLRSMLKFEWHLFL